MSAHKKRAIHRARCRNPINFTCGKCKQVHPFVDDTYSCPDDEVEEIPEEEPEEEVEE